MQVIHFEDNQITRETIASQVNTLSDKHQIVGGAGNLPAALETVDKIAAGQIDANVVLLDYDLGGDSEDSDAAAIVDRIKELGLAVRIVGLSTKSLNDSGIEVDADLDKIGFRTPTLIGVLNRLEELSN